jgi:hypothetical protein
MVEIDLLLDVFLESDREIFEGTQYLIPLESHLFI